MPEEQIIIAPDLEESESFGLCLLKLQDSSKENLERKTTNTWIPFISSRSL